jgi:uncharacterized protein (TIGR02266 family)
MTQDTRKDRRVKIVSLNVRYKSATVDEFIENHAHDVSRGGIYIKTGSPFPPGTLLKFEIRLASDQAVITGVGRVVWKRDTTQGTGERPSGMGVKFIKIDDPSKTVIDRLVNSRADAGRAYESESEAPSQEPLPAAAAAPPRPPSNRPPAGRVGKSTMLGMGAIPAAGSSRSTQARPGASTPPRPAGGGMFPKSSPEPDTSPKQEQTVMKQAAELLEEALREAGGSMEDVGTNPLFAGSAAPENVAVDAHVAAPPPGESPESVEAARTRAMVAGMSPGAPRNAHSDPPRTSRESPVAKAPERIEARPTSARASARVSVASPPPKPPKKGSGATLVVLAVAAAAAFAGIMYRDALFGAPAPTPAPSAAQVATASAAPSASDMATPPAASGPAAAIAEPSASASADQVADASLAASADAASRSAASASAASTSAASTPAAASVAAHALTPRPIAPRPIAPVALAPVAAAPIAPVASTTAAPAARDEAPSGGAAPTSTAPSVVPSTPTVSPPLRKPPKPADDNPY